MLISTDFRHTFGAQAAPDPGLPRRRQGRLRSCERGMVQREEVPGHLFFSAWNQSCGGFVAPAGGFAAPAGGFGAGAGVGEVVVAGAGAAGVVEGVALLVPAGAAASNRLMTSAVMSSAESPQTIPESLRLKRICSPRSATTC
jgi:hypothetical protein